MKVPLDEITSGLENDTFEMPGIKYGVFIPNRRRREGGMTDKERHGERSIQHKRKIHSGYDLAPGWDGTGRALDVCHYGVDIILSITWCIDSVTFSIDKVIPHKRSLSATGIWMEGEIRCIRIGLTSFREERGEAL
ncbi:hypothetical protein Tco_1209325 [Tanacetum coccineum]